MSDFVFVFLFKAHTIPRWRNCTVECTFPLLCSELLYYWMFCFYPTIRHIELQGDNYNFRKRISVSLKKINGMFVDNLKNPIALKVGALYNNKRESSLVPDTFSIKCTSAHIPFEVPFSLLYRGIAGKLLTLGPFALYQKSFRW